MNNNRANNAKNKKVCVQKYRSCVAIMIINDQKKVFMGKRIRSKNYSSENFLWQIPQGGIDENENAEMAMYRELFEETGISKDKIEILACHPFEIFYDIPENEIPVKWNGEFCGQKVTCFLAKFKGVDSDINLNITSTPEFNEFKWESYDNIVNNVVYFKKDMYLSIINSFSDIMEAIDNSIININ